MTHRNPNKGTAGVTSDAKFEFIEDAAVTGVVPTSGSRSGGAQVTVLGSGFSNVSGGTACVFGKEEEPVQAAVLSSTSMVCITPAQASGMALVGVVDAQHRVYRGRVGFMYSMLPRVLRLEPTHGRGDGGSL